MPPQLTLYRGFPPSPSHVWSPFVVKLELRLRLARIPYALAQGSPRTGPSGKIPYVDIAPLRHPSGDTSTPAPEQELLGDSTVIARALIEAGAASDLNAGLDAQQAALDAGLRALCEDKLYFLSARERWHDNYYVQRDHVMAPIPYPVRIVVGALAYRSTMAGLYAQGSGRLSKPEVKNSMQEIWGVVAGILVDARRLAGDGECFWVLGGREPTEADCSVFGFAVSALIAKSGPRHGEIVRGHEVVLEYARRIQKTYFAEYEAVC